MKKATLIVLAVLMAAGLWYFFIKPYDYLVTFKAKTFSGAINQSIKTWNIGLEEASILNQTDLNELTQQIKIQDSTFIYTWKIKPINDSLSSVKVYIKDVDHSLTNKLMLPFKQTDFEKRTIATVKDFVSLLNNHIASFKVKIEGKQELKSTFCAYVSLKGKQTEKAEGMMQYYTSVSNLLYQNGVAQTGPPFIEIVNWNMQKDSINYNFCFPIVKSEKLPIDPLIRYKRIYAKEAIKATYNGNYITSDRAWYALLNYADKNNIEVLKKPVEFFHNNPNTGGDELNWKAEIYMPIKTN
jgi:effector-binding domain-containing protein